MGGGASKRLASERQRVRFVCDVRAACVCSVERRSAARSVFAPCAGDARGGATADEGKGLKRFKGGTDKGFVSRITGSHQDATATVANDGMDTVA